VLAIVGTFIILKICDVTDRRARRQGRGDEGLDLSMHGEEGYIFEA
jgi:ammonia channel protein AmtB